MRRLALVVLLAGCGRLSFDQGAGGDAGAPVGDGGPSGDAGDGGPIGPVGHDEDGDGLGDAMDPCPHLPTLIPDGDGDGVGDACDPEPAIGRQQIVLFVTMTPEDPPTELLGGWVQNTDSLSFDGSGFARITVAKAFTAGRVVVGLDIEEQVGTPSQHQIAFGGGIAGSGTSYFGEVKQPMGMDAVAQLSLENNSSFMQLSATSIGTTIPLGPAQLTMDYTGTAQVAMEALVDGTSFTRSVAAPLYAGLDSYSVGSNDVRLTLRYVLVIRTN